MVEILVIYIWSHEVWSLVRQDLYVSGVAEKNARLDTGAVINHQPIAATLPEPAVMNPKCCYYGFF